MVQHVVRADSVERMLQEVYSRIPRVASRICLAGSIGAFHYRSAWRYECLCTLSWHHSAADGLYNVHVSGVISCDGLGPLLDGMVVSKRVLGRCVRETARNAWRRAMSEGTTAGAVRGRVHATRLARLAALASDFGEFKSPGELLRDLMVRV